MSSPQDSQQTIVAEAPQPPHHLRQRATITSVCVPTLAPLPIHLSCCKQNCNALEPDFQVAGSHTPRPPSKRQKKHIFFGKVFVITTHPELGNYARKGQFKQDLEHGGGLVEHSWEDLFDISLNPQSDGKKSWIETTRADVLWIGNEDIQEALLITDLPTQMQKYLIALALGILCINYKWISHLLKSPWVRVVLHCLSLSLTDRIAQTVAT